MCCRPKPDGVQRAILGTLQRMPLAQACRHAWAARLRRLARDDEQVAFAMLMLKRFVERMV
jgi:hypothetical protein